MTAEKVEEKKTHDSSKLDTVLLRTSKGDIVIKLYLDEAPITAGNFKSIVEEGFYDGLIFHRVVPGFVIQGGCPLGNGTGNFEDITTGKPRYIPLEKTDLRHDKPGVVAMARTQDPNTASSQFFIDVATLPMLDPGGVDPYGYAVFGQVVEGMEVVHKIVEDNVPPFPGDDGTTNPVTIVEAKIISRED